MPLRNLPTRLKVQHVMVTTYTLRDEKTGTHIATVGGVDKYYKEEYDQIARDLAHRYNHFLEMKEAIITAESALFYASTDGAEEPHTLEDVKRALETCRAALRSITQDYPKK